MVVRGIWRAVAVIAVLMLAASNCPKEARAQGTDDLALLRTQVSQLYSQGKYAEAAPIAERYVALARQKHGDTHTEYATAIAWLANVYRGQGLYPEAEPLYKRVLAIIQDALGPDHPEVAGGLNNLAELYSDQGRYAEAEPLYKRALTIAEKALGPEHLLVGTTVSSLAALFAVQGRYTEAEPLYKRALAITEKALGPDHPEVATTLNNLAELYREQGRCAESEPLYKRALTVFERELGPDHPEVAAALNNLALCYRAVGRHAEAEPLLKRALAIAEKVLGPDNPRVSNALNNLALLYYGQGRYAEAELLYKRSLLIREKALGPDHPDVGTALSNLAGLFDAQGRYAEAEPLYKRSLAIRETNLGPEHLGVAIILNNLATHALEQRNWALAAEYWRRATGVIERRAERGLAGSEGGSLKGEAVRNSWYFSGLIKMTDRLAPQGHADRARMAREMFETAQWAQASDAASSLTQMAARSAKGNMALAGLVRERQDLVGEWQIKDKQLIAGKSQLPAKRNPNAEKALSDRLAAIDGRLRAIDARFAKDFPEYASLASPKPASVGEVQTLLQPNEALVLFLATDDRLRPTPEETFIWVITKEDMRWQKSELGTKALTEGVAALRCGLDYDGAWGIAKSRCARFLKTTYTKADYDNAKPLPFDLGRAHTLYKELFGPIEDLIKDKHLLIVPSGSLTQLPFQVLVQSLLNDDSSGGRLREVGWLGLNFKNLTAEERKSLPSIGRGGVTIVKVTRGGPAEAAGLKPGDVVVSFDGVEYSAREKLIEAMRAHAPGAQVEFRVLRDAAEIAVTATFGVARVHEWVTRLLADGEGKSVDWLVRNHAVTVLPAVSSLKALRQFTKKSRASRTLIGFGNPLLDGPDADYASSAATARSMTSCPKFPKQRVAAMTGNQRGVLPFSLRSGLADARQVRSQVPLPETTDELCAVARDLGASEKDIWLGNRATEAEIKRLSEAGELAKYRIIHFATHGALAGQIGGNSEPGLILTPPATSNERDDGYLSASEVAQLKLDADWVILSACNTAAGGAEGAEALSGLARAFFYAGARALLVSHWSVDSQATVKLITGAVGRLVADTAVGRAEAMRQSMLALIDKGEALDAHPAYWAPFVVVGESGARM
jgi:CHAT domain-containing protein/tetratricopeptide (TPR) repeat protein